MRKISYRSGQYIIAANLFLFLAISVVMIFIGYARKFYYDTELRDLLIDAGKLFAPHLAIVIGAIFATQDSRANKRIDLSKALLAVVAAGTWGLIVVARLFLFVGDISQNERVSGLRQYFESVPETFGFLLAGIITFFFVRERGNN